MSAVSLISSVYFYKGARGHTNCDILLLCTSICSRAGRLCSYAYLTGAKPWSVNMFWIPGSLVVRVSAGLLIVFLDKVLKC